MEVLECVSVVLPQPWLLEAAVTCVTRMSAPCVPSPCVLQPQPCAPDPLVHFSVTCIPWEAGCNIKSTNITYVMENRIKIGPTFKVYPKHTHLKCNLEVYLSCTSFLWPNLCDFLIWRLFAFTIQNVHTGVWRSCYRVFALWQGTFQNTATPKMTHHSGHWKCWMNLELNVLTIFYKIKTHSGLTFRHLDYISVEEHFSVYTRREI